MDGSFEEIHKYLSQGEILAQLAEECIELAQAALKLRRALDGANPTPKTVYDCTESMNEEFADVAGCLDALIYSGFEFDTYVINELKVMKEARWLHRLHEREQEQEVQHG